MSLSLTYNIVLDDGVLTEPGVERWMEESEITPSV